MDILSKLRNQIPARPLAESDEAGIIMCAQAGETEAIGLLLANYTPLLLKVIGREFATRTQTAPGTHVPMDEIESSAIMGFFDAVATFDPTRHSRLAQILELRAASRIREDRIAHRHPINIPPIMYSRFTRALAQADGDVSRARDIAPDLGLSVATFDAIAALLAGTHLNEIPGSGVNDPSHRRHPVLNEGVTDRIEDVTDAHRALDALDTESRLIIETLFGFGREPMSEREASAALGIPRTTLQRKAARALDVMRSTLGA
jgi:DNA-directed RNA polymerase specialized sigma subunit